MIPLVLKSVPQLIQILGKWVPTAHHVVDMITIVLNTVHIRGIGGPREQITAFKVEEALGMPGMVLQIAILLKIDVGRIQVMVREGAEEVRGEDVNVLETIHDPIDLM